MLAREEPVPSPFRENLMIDITSVLHTLDKIPLVYLLLLVDILLNIPGSMINSFSTAT